MSVIIKEIYWQEYDTTTQIRSVRADIICDALADLPSGGILDDYKLDIGSRAKVIADGSEWEIQSTGSWVRQPSKLQLDLTGYATQIWVNGELAGYVSTTTYNTDQAAQDAAIATKITAADVFGAGSMISDNADLNDFKDDGKYYGTNSAGASVSNLPVANSNFNFSLEVKKASPVHILQYLTILRTADNAYIYRRRYYNGTWTSWYRFEGVQV